MDRKKFEDLPTTRLSQEIYYRLDLPELLQNDSKIIYLDVDIIVNCVLRPENFRDSLAVPKSSILCTERASDFLSRFDVAKI